MIMMWMVPFVYRVCRNCTIGSPKPSLLVLAAEEDVLDPKNDLISLDIILSVSSYRKTEKMTASSCF